MIHPKIVYVLSPKTPAGYKKGWFSDQIETSTKLHPNLKECLVFYATVEPAMPTVWSRGMEQLGLLELNRLIELLLCLSAEMPSFAPITLRTLSWLEGNWTSEKNLTTLHKAARMRELLSEYTLREPKGSVVMLAKALQETQSCLSVLRQAAFRVVLCQVEL